MPQRTNAFQKVVLLLQEQLGEGARIFESRFLKNRLDGRENEVDIVVESTVGGYPIIVSIECIDRNRPATRGWVHEMWGKHEHLPTDKLVLISSAGFSKSAAEFAHRLGIDTLSIEQASNVDWTRFVNKLHKIIVEVVQSQVKAFPILQDGYEALLNTVMARDQLLFNEDRTLSTTVGNLLDVVTTTPEVGRVFMDKMHEEGQRTGVFTAMYRFPRPFPIVDSTGSIRRCEKVFMADATGTVYAMNGLRIVFDAQRSTTPIALKHGSLKDTPVAYGDADGEAGKLLVAVVEQEQRGAKVAVTRQERGRSQPLVNVDQTSGLCQFTKIRRSVRANTGKGSLKVAAPTGIAWTATSDVAWITIERGAGIGAGDIEFSVSANDSIHERVGTIAVGDTALIIAQAGVKPSEPH